MSLARKCDVCGVYGEDVPGLVMKVQLFSINPTNIYVMDLCAGCRKAIGIGQKKDGREVIIDAFRELFDLKQPLPEASNADPMEALGNLVDVQNGPPLTQKRYAIPWYDAMMRACRCLGRSASVVMYAAQKRDHIG